MILSLLSKELRNLADRIDSGNTYLTEEEQMEIIQFVKGFEKDKPSAQNVQKRTDKQRNRLISRGNDSMLSGLNEL